MFDIVYYTLYSLAIIGIVIMAALVYLRKKEPEYRYFAVFALLLALWLALQFSAQLFSSNLNNGATAFLRLSVAVAPFFTLFFFFFALRHVGLKVKKGRHFVFPVIASIVSITTPFVVQGGSASIEGITLQDGPLYSPIFSIVILYFLTAIAFIIKANRSKRKPIKPSLKQANYIIIVGILQAIFIISLASIIFADDHFAQVLSPLAMFFMVAIFSYAIIRHRLFDIRLVAVRALGYSFSLVTIGAAYALLAFGLVNTFASEQDGSLQQVLYLVIALLLALTFAPLKAFFDSITRTIFYQDSYESQKVIDDFSTILVSTVDIKDLGQNAAEVLRIALKSEYVAIIVPFDSKRAKNENRLIINGKNTLSNEETLFKSLSRYKEKLFVQDVIYTENKQLYEKMQASNCAVAARLETHDDFIGYILFGVKNSGRAYTTQDIELIRITSDELALGIQNALRFEEIRLFNRTLQERVEEATLQLRRTNTELRRLDEAKDEFVSMASHQLRTPLTSVKGYISMVLEGDGGKLTTMQRQLLEEAFTSSERMVHLINDFLNVSRLQTGKFVIEEKAVDLAKVIAQEVDSLQSTAKAHDLRIDYRKPSYFPVLYLDEGKIRQVLMNFIDNAIYYTPEGSIITVSLTIDEGFAVLTVKDQGIGVPKSEQTHLFTKFYRASNARKQRPDGTGVGLFLAKKVVTAQGGTMVFESEEGKGSTFGFRLPIKKLSNSSAQKAD